MPRIASFSQRSARDVHVVVLLARARRLEDDPLHVGREVRLAGAVEAAGELDDVAEQRLLRLLRRVNASARDAGDERETASGEQDVADHSRITPCRHV